MRILKPRLQFFAIVLCAIFVQTKWIGFLLAMKRIIFSIVFSLLISGVQPAVASPQTDADYIADHFVTADDFQTLSRKMVVKAFAGGLASALATRSVKIKDQDKFVALLPDTVSGSMFARLQKTAADNLVQNWDAAQLASFADYLRKLPLVLQAGPSVATENTQKPPLSVEELPSKITALGHDDTFKNEMALTAVGVMLIALVVLEANKIEIDLRAPYVADMLEVNGVFSFPNRIVRNDLIRELRGSGS